MASLATRPELHKGPIGPLRDRCAQCLLPGPRLMLCTGCRAVRYCSREHQVEHRPTHKSNCIGIKKERARVEKEDYLVRHQQEDFMTPANAFETHVGMFYGILETRVYMRARFILADHLRLMGTPDSVGEAADHMLDMLRLNRRDNMGQRDFVPAVLLRLDRDQEMYDFVKWWATVGATGDYDGEGAEAPHVGMKGENVLEASKFLMGEFPDLSHLVAMLLLKLKLVLDIRSIKASRWVLSHNSPLPPELRLCIEEEVVRSPLSAKLFVGKPMKELNAIEVDLSQQVSLLGYNINDANRSFWDIFFDPDSALVIHPEAYSPGSPEESALVLQQTYSAYWETAGVVDILNEARKISHRNSEKGVPDLAKFLKMKMPGKNRTHAEIHEGMSLTQMWRYLDWAVQDASYLGNWKNRPSERYTKRADLEDWEVEEASEDAMGNPEDWSDTDGSDAE